MESISQKMFILGATSVSAIMIGTYLFKVAFGKSSPDENEVCFEAIEPPPKPAKPASSDAPLKSDVMESSVSNTNVYFFIFCSNYILEQLVNSSEFQNTIGFQDTNNLFNQNYEHTPLPIDCSLQRFESRMLDPGPDGSWFGIGNSSDSHLFFVIFLNKKCKHADYIHIFHRIRIVISLSQRKLKINHPEFVDEWKSGRVLSKVLAVDEFKILESFDKEAKANNVPSFLVDAGLGLGPTRVSDLKKILRQRKRRRLL